jgi:Putative Flp pilus-assembly TadE/G-like
MGNMSQETRENTGLFRRLAKDATANTLAISAASLVPLMAMVGGGVDASRFYMAEARLQAACDAGALAARRAMSNGEFDEDVEGTDKSPNEIGDAFFEENFSDGLFGIKSLSHTYTATTDDEVKGVASGTMPTSIMAAFGYKEVKLAVECQADINIANTDIVLALDTTGSMSGQPIADLRAATLAFYDTVEDATSSDAQVRYGIVPYSNQINVGHLLQSSWMKNNHTYQSRETVRTYGTPQVESIDVVRTGSAYNFQNLSGQEYYSEVLYSYNDCVDIAFTNQPNNNTYLSHDLNDFTLVSQTTGNPRISVYEGPAKFLSLSFASGTWYGSRYSTNRECRLYFNRRSYLADSTLTIVEDVPYTWEWEYKPVSYDVSGVFGSKTLTAPTGADMVNQTHSWNGCIEEADTVNTATWNPVPAGAYDLDIDLVPSTDAEKWAPMLGSLVKPRYQDGTSKYRQGNYVLGNMTSLEDKEAIWTICPKAARQLDEMPDRTELVTYLAESNGFIADGATYHDLGMIWAGRMISPDGIFASRNATAPNGDAISRHVVFMTDGVMFGNNRVYSPYGYEWWDRRVTSDGDQNNNTAIHAERFQAACRAVRNKNVTIWVVAFGTSLTQNLIDCATPGRAYRANDGDALDAAFRDIAEKIADLRLTQ